MRFSPTDLAGVVLVDMEPIEDERGFFARTFCAETFARHGLASVYPQCNLSHNRRRGTLRGLHFQAPPGMEAKLVRCTRGRLLDVVADLRPDSPTLGRFVAVELRADATTSLYIPEDLAHGFQCLEDNTEVFYQMSAPYRPELARGVRHDDPDLAIPWPIREKIVSDQDRNLPTLARVLSQW